jgi:membrane-associated protease RseP (regulator of RpoE activity)
MRNELKWALAALALGVLAIVGFAVAAAVRGGGEEEQRAIRIQTNLAPERDLEPLPEAVQARPFVGVSLTESDEGVEITGVIPDSPADEADLREGDLIRAIDGEKVDSVEAVIERVRDAEPGDELTFTVEREGRELEIEVRLSERAGLDLLQDYWGIAPGQLRERLREFDWEELLPEEWFGNRRDLLDKALERFISGEVRYLDEEGKPASVQALGGTVSSIDVSKGTLTVTSNEPQAAPETFTITDDTRIRRDLRRAELADLEVNDRVVVIAVGGGDEAAVVLAFSVPEES